MEPIAEIRITMTANGQIGCQCKTPSRSVFLMMMETAKLDMNDKMQKQEASRAAIEVAPPGMQVVRNGNG